MNKINLLHPKAKACAEKLLNICKHTDVKIVKTIVTKKQQNKTQIRYPNNPHCFGVAFDIECSDKYINQISKVGKQIGLSWEGKFNKHFQLQEFLPNNSTKYLSYKYQNLENFKKTWWIYKTYFILLWIL